VRSESCPHCGVSLVGTPVPVSHQEAYGGVTHFSRKIGVEILGGYDGVLFYQCPDCDGRWHRWPEGSPLRAEAEACWAKWSKQ
jgi:hypothetical protein